MTVSRTLRRSACFGAMTAAVFAVSACGAGVIESVTPVRATVPVHAVTINKDQLLHPAHKYYGIFEPGAPDNIASITDRTNPASITSETGKQPNLVLYYQAWDSLGLADAAGATNFDSTGAANACAAGMLPMLTWESWDTTVTSTTNPPGGTAYAQPNFSLYNIIHGKFDNYIRATADAVKALNCPIAIRLDQEQNGYWYPWGMTTVGMTGNDQATPERYDVMWRHVWNIFQAEGATNVLWVWSPNFVQRAPTVAQPTLQRSYPGDKYVDWIGLDGYYYNNPTMNFSTLFGRTLAELTFATAKPWFVAETGIGGTALTEAQSAAEMTNLLAAVAKRPAFNGLVYFNQSLLDEDRANWQINQNPATLKAFRTGIDRPVYAGGATCTLTKCPSP
jgi:mannan endo-1,4-beta-mannosidase